jgi:ubiquinone/menaquinone biosynthesis C-methylase UbiE
VTAKRVGPSGYVLATDISSNILNFAQNAARRAGLKNVHTEVMDGENLEVPDDSFDTVISRVGLIYFLDQHKALAGMNPRRPGPGRRPRRRAAGVCVIRLALSA